MSDPTASNQTEPDDWAAAMAEQAAAIHNDSTENEAGVDDWAAAMAEQAASTRSQSDIEKSNNSVTGAKTATATVFQEFSKESTPFVQPDMELEMLAVARALDAAEIRQTELLARERDFSANLSHELRTPLAGIRSDAEMLATNEALPDGVRRRAARIITATDSTTQLAETLLLLAREARPQLLEAVSVADATRRAWGAIQSQSTKPVKLELQIPESAVLQADSALLQIVLRNLLANALRHGEGLGVSCVLEGSRLCVQDRGPGLPEGDPDGIFQRFHRRGQKPGHGLGLALGVCYVVTISLSSYF